MHGGGFALVAPIDLCQRLVPALIQIAALKSGTETGTAAGAITETIAVNTARCGGQVDLHRYLFVLRGFRWRTDIHQPKIIQRHQRLSQAFELGGVIRRAGRPAHQLAQHILTNDGRGRLHKFGLAQAIARPTAPAQVDIRRMLGAGDLDLMANEIGIEIPLRRQHPVDPGFAGLVQTVIQHLANLRHKQRQCGAHLRVGGGGTGNIQGAAADPHRQAGIDVDADDQLRIRGVGAGGLCIGICIGIAFGILRRHSAAIAALNLDYRRVIPERLQCLTHLGIGLMQQIRQPPLAEIFTHRILQGQRATHVIGQPCIADPVDVDAGHRDCGCRQRRKAEHQHGEEAIQRTRHLGRITAVWPLAIRRPESLAKSLNPTEGMRPTQQEC